MTGRDVTGDDGDETVQMMIFAPVSKCWSSTDNIDRTLRSPFHISIIYIPTSHVLPVAVFWTPESHLPE